MKYGKTVRAKFISRPNRFIAYADVDGERVVCHVKNTGRCKELLTEGCTVILEQADREKNPARKTDYDLIAVYKGGLLINMDSQSPNKAAYEFIPRLFENVTLIKPETVYGDSRFDFYIEAEGRRIFMEVKGCTLENEGVCKFPDAPTERGVKHLNELVKCISDGYEAYILFVIQMERAMYFTPNSETHPEFAEALKNAEKNGVKVLAYSCNVEEDSMTIRSPVEIRLQ